MSDSHYQATVEDFLESTTKDGNSIPANRSTLSTDSRLCTVPASRNSAAWPSIDVLASILTSFFAWHGLLPGYIEQSEGMETIG